MKSNSNLEILENKARTNCGGRWVRVLQHNDNSQRIAMALVFDEPSEMYGIEGGRISKFFVEKHEGGFVHTEANYDRGWDTLPATEEAQDFCNQVFELFN